MRTISGSRNRLALAVAGLLALTLGAVLLAQPVGLGTVWPRVDELLPAAGTPIGDILAERRIWALVIACVLAVLAVVLGLVLLLSQVPARPSAPRLRIVGDDGSLLGSMEPQVLERALSDRLEELTGVHGAGVHLSGAASAAWLQVDLTISDRAEAAWAVDGARTRLVEDVRSALGDDPRAVDILVHIDTGSSGTQRASVTSGPVGRSRRSESVEA